MSTGRASVPATALRAIVAVTVVALTLGVAGPAWAHASLVRTQPSDGSTTVVAPRTVTLTFDENVRTPSVVTVTDPSGQHVQHGPTQVVDNTLRVKVAISNPGRYTVAYRVVSADGHPVAGTTTFAFEPSGSAAPGSSPASAGPGMTEARHHAAGGGGGGLRLAGVVALVALVAGFALLAFRRPSGGWQHPGKSSR
jgi:methionine-rich copper-binding protein CopC